MIELINNYIFAILESAVLFFGLYFILPIKKGNRLTKKVVLVIATFCYFGILFLCSELSTLFRSIILIAFCVSVTHFCFDVRYETRFFFAIVTFELNLLADSIVGHIFSYFIRDNIINILELNELNSFILALSSKILFVIFEAVFIRFSKKFVFTITRKYWITVDFIMIIIYGLILWFLNISPDLQTFVSPYQMSIASISFVFIFLLLIYFFREVCISQQRESETYRTLLTNKILENQIESIQSNAENVNKMKHDIRNHIACIEQLSKKSEDLLVEDYCKKLCVQGNFLESNYINHDVINAILNYKIAEIKKNRIEYKLEIEDVSDMNISSVDITGILSNLIDNAIDANKKLPEKERCMVIQICNYKGYLVFYIKNKYDKKLKIENHSLYTTKDDYKNHGFGLKIISEITEKYSGIFRQYPEADYFSSLVMLQI